MRCIIPHQSARSTPVDHVSRDGGHVRGSLLGSYQRVDCAHGSSFVRRTSFLAASSRSAMPVACSSTRTPLSQRFLPHTLTPALLKHERPGPSWQSRGTGQHGLGRLRRVRRAIPIQTNTSLDHMDSADGQPGEEKLPDTSARWKQRFTIVGLCAVAFLLCNLDRVNMSIAILPMAEQFQWDSRTMGLVQSSFFWGYLLTQIIGGVLADRIGGKTVLGIGVLWWSLATVLTPLAAMAGLGPLLAMRAMMGIGEGVAMPAMNSLLSSWVPSMERSRALALVYSGMYTGSIIGLGLSPNMCDKLGWPSVFTIFGVLGVLWAGLWNFFAANSPATDPRISQEEKAYVEAYRTRDACDSGTAESIPWKKLLSKPAVWAIIVAHFCHNWGLFILLTWMPTYYKQVLGLNLAKSGLFSVLPWLAMAVMANVGGWLADTMIKRGFAVGKVRKIMQSIGFLGPAVALSILPVVDKPWQAVLCMCMSQGMDAFSQSGLYSNHQDIGPKYAGVLLGITNTAGVLAGVLGTLVTGRILAAGGWDAVWQIAVGMYLFGAAWFNVFAKGEKVID